MSTPGTAGNTRTINIMGKALAKDVTLVFTFEPVSRGKLIRDIFPVCWKVMQFRKGSIDNGLVMYTSDTGFLTPQYHDGNIVYASSARRCQSGQSCDLVTEGGENYLTAPVQAENADKIVQCKVKTDLPATVGFGIFDKTGTKIEPIFTWKKIATGETVSLELTPLLKIYAVTDIEVSEEIRGYIQSPMIFRENLMSLPRTTNWEVYIDNMSNSVEMKRRS